MGKVKEMFEQQPGEADWEREEREPIHLTWPGSLEDNITLLNKTYAKMIELGFYDDIRRKENDPPF